MTKRIATLFFILALTILIILGVLMGLDQTSDSKNALACQENPKYQLPDSFALLWNDPKYLVGFDKNENSLQLFSWSLDNTSFTPYKVSSIPLKCQTPGYHCAPQDLDVTVRNFQPPYGILEITKDKKTKSFPFSWNSKEELRFGSPLQLCSQNLSDIKKGKFFWLQEQLFFYDYERNILGQFDLNRLTGATFTSANLDAQRVLTISNEGFIEPTTCTNLSTNSNSEPYHIYNEGLQILLFRNDSLGMVYTFNKDFIPLFKTTASVRSVLADSERKSIYFRDSQDIYQIAPQALEEKPLKLAPALFSPVQHIETNSPIIYSQHFQKAVSASSQSYFGKNSISVFDLKRGLQESFTLPAKLFKRGFDYLSLGIHSPSISYFFSQQGNMSAEFSSISCSL